VNIYKDDFYANWNLTLQQSVRALRVLNSNQPSSIQQLLNSLRLGQEPMQVVISGEFCEDSSHLALNENSHSCLTV
jgi:NTE family protein